MTINIADNTPRVSYTVAQGATQSSFTVDYEFFDNADLNVYLDGTLKTISTHYTVSGGDGSTGTVTMSVIGASGGSTVVITRSIALERTTDFPASGAFQINSLNTELDRFTAIAADLNDEIGRSLRLTDYDIGASLVLPDVDARKGRTLAFNSTTGAVEAGPTIGDVSSISAITADIATLADIEDGTDATDAIQTVATISGNVTTVAGVSTAVSTNATNIASINTNAANITDIQNAEENATKAENYAIKIDGAIPTTSNYSSKAWAIGGTGVTDTAGSGSAKSWAVEVDAVDGTEHSAKSYAISGTAISSGSAKQWALGGGNSFATNTAVAGGVYSARYYAEQAAAAVDGFDDTYLGPKSSDPTVDNDGDALTAGDLYFNTASNVMKVYNGSAWNEVAADTSSFATNGFSIAMAIAL